VAKVGVGVGVQTKENYARNFVHSFILALLRLRLRIQILGYRYADTHVCLQLTCCGQLSSLERRSTVQVKRKCIF